MDMDRTCTATFEELPAAEECPCNAVAMTGGWSSSGGFTLWSQFVGTVPPTAPPSRVPEECNAAGAVVELVDVVVPGDVDNPRISVDSTSGAEQCTAFPVAGITATYSLSAGQAAGCRAVLEARAAETGVTCM